MKINVAFDFTTAPGPRLMSEGDFSGEEFRKEILLPKLKQAIQTSSQLEVILDGTSGYATSFLEECFGGLIREDNIELAAIKSTLVLVSVEEPDLIEEIYEYLNDAEKARKDGMT
jgi:hypothetical protein